MFIHSGPEDPKGKIEVCREGLWVYMRIEGPEYLNDEELLQQAVAREEELQRTVRELERLVAELKLRASELEQEPAEAKELASAGRQPYQELEKAYRKEVAEHNETK